MKRIILVKSRYGYPTNYTPLFIHNGEYCLGDGRNTKCVIAKNSKDAQRIMYKARKQLKIFNLIYYTKIIDDLEREEE